MTDWKQFLTKQIFKESSFTNTVTISCDGRVWLPRTYGNRIDLMDLYEKVYEDGKWREFCDLSASKDYFYVDSLPTITLNGQNGFSASTVMATKNAARWLQRFMDGRKRNE